MWAVGETDQHQASEEAEQSMVLIESDRDVGYEREVITSGPVSRAPSSIVVAHIGCGWCGNAARSSLRHSGGPLAQIACFPRSSALQVDTRQDCSTRMVQAVLASPGVLYVLELHSEDQQRDNSEHSRCFVARIEINEPVTTLWALHVFQISAHPPPPLCAQPGSSLSVGAHHLADISHGVPPGIPARRLGQPRAKRELTPPMPHVAAPYRALPPVLGRQLQVEVSVGGGLLCRSRMTNEKSPY